MHINVYASTFIITGRSNVGGEGTVSRSVAEAYNNNINGHCIIILERVRGNFYHHSIKRRRPTTDKEASTKPNRRPRRKAKSVPMDGWIG